MSQRHRSAPSVLLLPLLVLVASSCGGGGTTQVFFASVGSGDCTSVTVDVDVDAAGAALATDAAGDPDCAIVDALAEAGCEALFSWTADGLLRATVGGCTVPPAASLFHCAFSSGDELAIGDETTATCACTVASCDAAPPVCVQEGADAPPCEDCDNGVDDDRDGDLDCDDDVCRHDGACEASTTTSSTSSTTYQHEWPSTTGTITTTTTPTFPCTVTFQLLDDVTLGALMWRVDATAAPGDFVGSGDAVECVGLVPGAMSVSNLVGEDRLSVALISLEGIDGPAGLTTCRFVASRIPGFSDFDVTVLDAADLRSEAVEPFPTIVPIVECGGMATTTSTLDPNRTTTTTLPPPLECRVRFQTNSTRRIGALQWSVDYAKAPGYFRGRGGKARCSSLVTGEFAAFTDVEAAERLDAAIVSLDGFTGPRAIASCDFAADVRPDSSDFRVSVLDGAEPDNDPIQPPPLVFVVIECDGDPPPTTTLPEVTEPWEVRVTLHAAPTLPSSLQVAIDYLDAHGGFPGEGAAVECRSEVEDALFAFYDHDEARELKFALATLGRFATGSPLVTCRFDVPESADDPVPADFVLRVEDAADPGGNAVAIDVSLAVTPAP